jgi:DNA-binding response OmpR family regulator
MLDTDAHTLYRGTEEVELTRKEFRLLEYLLSNAGRALTRNEILNAILGTPRDRHATQCGPLHHDAPRQDRTGG